MYNAGSSSISMCAGQQHNCSLNIINMQIDIEQNNHPVIHFPWPDQISSYISDINETSTRIIYYVFCHQRNVIANMNMKQIKMQINNINTNIGLLDSIFEIYVWIKIVINIFLAASISIIAVNQHFQRYLYRYLQYAYRFQKQYSISIFAASLISIFIAVEYHYLQLNKRQFLKQYLYHNFIIAALLLSILAAAFLSITAAAMLSILAAELISIFTAELISILTTASISTCAAV